MRVLTAFFASLVAVTAFADDPVSLQAPFRAEAAGVPIDLSGDGVGHAAPIFFDWDGDGLRDLLVGQFGDGKLRIYRNTGKKDAPAFEGFEWFKAGGEVAKVETG